MADILDYIKWRGDLSISADHFNHLDAAILSQLVMIDFSKIVHKNHHSISIEDAFKVYEKSHNINEKLGLVISEKTNQMFELMANAKRFKNWQLSYYKDVYDEEKCIQFSAITVQVKPGLSAIVYSGTNDTLTGWQEDLGMMYQQMPSYELASQYLMNAIKYKLDDVIIIGHSKGGALATHATLNLEGKLQKKIIKTYCFDGPGMDFNLYLDKKYINRWKKVIGFIPEMAVIGQLFNHNEKQFVVKSGADLLFQHDLFTWEVLGKDFIYEFGVSQESIYLRYKFHTLIDSMSKDERIFLVNSLFKLFTLSECKTLTDVSNKRKKVVASIMKLTKVERQFINKYLISGFFGDKKVSRIIMDIVTKKRKFKLNEDVKYIPIK